MIVAVVALAALVALQVYLTVAFARAGETGWATYAAAALLWALLVFGLWRRSRLAWLWGRYLTLVLGVAVAARLTLGAVRGEMGGLLLAAAALGLCLPLFTAGIALGRPSVARWFDLVCPSCAAPTSLGADLLFRQARCRRCDTRW